MDQQRKNSTPRRDRDLSENVEGALCPVELGRDDWSEIVPFEGTPGAPPLPIDVFPRPIREWIDATARSLQVPTDLLAGTVLGALATMVHGGVKVGVRRGWKEGTNIFVGVVAKSGRMKSPAFEKAFAPVATFENELREAAAAEVRDAQIKRDELERDIERRKHISKNTKDDKERAIVESEIADCKKALEEMRVPVLPRLRASDATPEALVRVLAEQKGVLTIASGEDALFAQLAGRYNDNPAIECVLQGYSNERISIDRVREGGSFTIESPCLTIVTSLQPAVLADVLGNDRNEERGLGARFAFILPPRYDGGPYTLRTPPVPDDVERAYSDALLKLGRAARDADIFLAFSAEARDAFDAWYGPVRAYAESETTDAARARWLAKQPGRCARIAALLHVASHGLGSTSVSARTVRDAIRFSDALAEHFEAALRIGADDGSRRVDVLAKSIVAWAVNLGRPFTQSEVTRKFRTRKGDHIRDEALAALEERSFLRRSQGRGARATTTWETHPDAGLHVPSSDARPWRRASAHAPERGKREFDTNTLESKASQDSHHEFPSREFGKSTTTEEHDAVPRIPEFPTTKIDAGNRNRLVSSEIGPEFPNSRNPAAQPPAADDFEWEVIVPAGARPYDEPEAF